MGNPVQPGAVSQRAVDAWQDNERYWQKLFRLCFLFVTVFDPGIFFKTTNQFLYLLWVQDPDQMIIKSIKLTVSIDSIKVLWHNRPSQYTPKMISQNIQKTFFITMWQKAYKNLRKIMDEKGRVEFSSEITYRMIKNVLINMSTLLIKIYLRKLTVVSRFQHCHHIGTSGTHDYLQFIVILIRSR